MNKRYKILLIIIVLYLFLSGCSLSSSSDKINVKLDQLKFNEEIGDKIGGEFGRLTLGSTAGLVEWHNTYVEDPDDEMVYELARAIETFVVDDIGVLLRSDLMNTTEMKIHTEYLKVAEEVTIRTLETLKIKDETNLRKKNLKELSDDEFENLQNRKENHIKTIRNAINKILESYFE